MNGKKFKFHVSALRYSWLETFRMVALARWKKSGPAEPAALPRHIASYRLVKRIERPVGDREFQFGLYRDDQGKEAIVKQWSGSKKDFGYYWLKNEIAVYQQFTSLYRATAPVLANLFPRIRPPNLLAVVQGPEQLLLLAENVAGQSLADKPAVAIETFEEALRYLAYINEFFTPKARRHFLKRGMWYVVGLFPLLLLRAFFRNPKQLRQLAKAGLEFGRLIPLLLENNELSFIHRDLTYFNLFITPENDIRILDFELSVLAHPIFELTTIVTGSWYRENFLQEFYKLKVMKQVLSHHPSFEIYRGLSIYTAVHRLATTVKTELPNHYFYLEHALKLVPLQPSPMTESKSPVTLSVGIPAYNEQENVLALLQSIFAQEQRGYKLEEVIVVSDGSSDKTESLVREFALSQPKVRLVADGKRLGNAARLNELFHLAKGDLLVNLDGDVSLSGPLVLAELVAQFASPEVGLVGGNDAPAAPESLFEKIVATSVQFWYEVRKDLNRGNTVYNHHGCVSALRREFYLQAQMPEDILAIDTYLYFRALELGFTFRHAKKAVVYYHVPATPGDFLTQSHRFLQTKGRISAHFGNWIEDYREVNWAARTKAVMKMLFRTPVFTPLALMLLVLTRVLHAKPEREYQSGIWEPVKSTKRGYGKLV